MSFPTLFPLFEIGNGYGVMLRSAYIAFVLRFEIASTEPIRKSFSIDDNIVTGANELFSVHSIQNPMPNHKIATDLTVWVFRNFLKTIWRRERLYLSIIAVLQPLDSFSQY
jgi:hypothetical protein